MSWGRGVVVGMAVVACGSDTTIFGSDGGADASTSQQSGSGNAEQIIDPLADVGDDHAVLSVPCGLGTTDCNAALDAIFTAIDVGGNKLGLAVPEIEALKSLISEPDSDSNTGLKHWRCDGGLTLYGLQVKPNVCKLVVRAKRLNVYPDEFELVWFDDKELDNPAYAVYVAAVGANSADVFCNAPVNEPTGSFRRPLATLSIGPIYLDF